MLIQNTYLDNCLTGKEEFDPVKFFKENSNKYIEKNLSFDTSVNFYQYIQQVVNNTNNNNNSFINNSYTIKNLLNPKYTSKELINNTFSILLEKEFEEDFKKIRKINLNKLIKLAIYHDVDIYDQLIYIYSAIVCIPKLATSVILGQTIEHDHPIIERYPSNESIKEIYLELQRMNLI